MAVLITGGAGYIGTHTCVELLNDGYEIIVVDNFSNSQPESLRRVKELTGREFKTYAIDLLDAQSLERVFTENLISSVVHFAGLKAVGESVADPLWYYRNNVIGTIILCEVMKKFQVKNIVFSSSATVYGQPDQVPIRENALLKTTNPYGRTKHMIEEILRDLYISDSSWSVALLRYFNPIGAHKSGMIGESPKGIPNNLLPYISQVAVGSLDELRVFGNDYETKDGTGVRDYIHVVDLAIGHVRALEKIESSDGVHTYNLGTGKGYSVLEMVDTFEETSGKSIPYTILGRRPGDIPICFAETTKANVELGWRAERGIDEMCEDTWRWQSLNPNGYEQSNTESETSVPSKAADFFVTK
ncbi:UDP-glucose 4-epimerase GalE [Halobacillus sp. BBL2006]|uniref:UDP-glucose 4-epimerase GalE n=1 Tax=Halobacillus sp. BBL2006 TaxID=1543706 RepID=UPI0005426759|nr:UDP-glucose 4-epimerase GalE [Halobacillus sp. BBL2006]KHE69244.1 UDP-galactose-4-epimerase [Halobacillus sp. BBL2006]